MRRKVGHGSQGWLCLLWLAASLFLAQQELKAEPAPAVGGKRIAEKIGALLDADGLGGPETALALFSTRHGKYLFRQHSETPMIAASNAKLAVTYAALKQLTPGYRWETRFYQVEEYLGPAEPTRQGLLVRGSADPSLTRADLDHVALVLKSKGIWRLDGAIFLENTRGIPVHFPEDRPHSKDYPAWSAKVSSLIVNQNTLELVLAANPGGVGYTVLSDLPFVSAEAAITVDEKRYPSLKIAQGWHTGGGWITLRGRYFSQGSADPLLVAVSDPRLHFYHQFREALHRAGILGDLPLGRGTSGSDVTRFAYRHRSQPLAALLPQINKHSSNLSADVLVITMGLGGEPPPYSLEPGLREIRLILEHDFPKTAAALTLTDGSGLSRGNKLSARFLVQLLNRVLSFQSFNAEFLNSLSIAGVDGTLQFRNLPPRLWGRVRGKTGTLRGVQNLSGYMHLPGDLVVFSFLINHPGMRTGQLMSRQDRALTGIYDLLLPPGHQPVPRPPRYPKQLVPAPLASVKPPTPAPPKAISGRPGSSGLRNPPASGPGKSGGINQAGDQR